MAQSDSREVVSRPAKSRPPRGRASPPAGVDVLLNKAQVQLALGISERTLWAWRAAGEFPQPDVEIGKVLRWKTSTVAGWIDARARRKATTNARGEQAR